MEGHVPPSHLDEGPMLPREPQDPPKLESGISPFDGVFGTTWYGWARKGRAYKEGPTRRLKMRARLDAWRLARKLGW